jgi:hypothetical protein
MGLGPLRVVGHGAASGVSSWCLASRVYKLSHCNKPVKEEQNAKPSPTTSPTDPAVFLLVLPKFLLRFLPILPSLIWNYNT